MTRLAFKRPTAPRRFNSMSRRRFALERMSALSAELHRDPSYSEMLIIGRIIAIEWDLRRQDAKLDAGEELSPHALRHRLAAENRLRLDLQMLTRAPRGKADPGWQEAIYGGNEPDQAAD